MMIRSATAKDIERIAEILVFNNRINYFPIFQDIVYSFKEYTVLSVYKQLNADSAFIKNTFVFEDVVVKGFICVVNQEITKLYVEPFFQNKGIGHQLIEFAIEHKNAAYLWALEKNEKALRFYESHGFHKNGERKPEIDTPEYLIKLIR